MNQTLGLISVVVRDYDEALAFYVGKLGFKLLEDSFIAEQNKRWVVIKPQGEGGAALLLARASNEAQLARVGSQTGGRVFLFLYTDDLLRDVQHYRSQGIRFIREPDRQAHGFVAVFEDCYGNAWDLIEPSNNRYWLS